jgi:hypothetical protein
MAEDEDLEILGPGVSATLATADDEADEGADDDVEEGQHRPIVPGLSERESGFPTPTRTDVPECPVSGPLRQVGSGSLARLETRRPRPYS